MTLVIIASDKHIQNALQQALLGISEDVQRYSQVRDIPKTLPAPAAIIGLVDTNNANDLHNVSKTTPVFGLTNSKIEIEEKIEDEFVFFSKSPIRLGNLVNAVCAYLKNRKQKDKMKPITLGNFILDPRSNNLENKKTKENIQLTEKEQDMLLFLLDQKGRPVTKEVLLGNVWGYAEGVETHTLETHIYRLRKKVEADPTAPKFLITDENGYVLKF